MKDGPRRGCGYRLGRTSSAGRSIDGSNRSGMSPVTAATVPDRRPPSLLSATRPGPPAGRGALSPKLLVPNSHQEDECISALPMSLAVLARHRDERNHGGLQPQILPGARPPFGGCSTVSRGRPCQRREAQCPFLVLNGGAERATTPRVGVERIGWPAWMSIVAGSPAAAMRLCFALCKREIWVWTGAVFVQRFVSAGALWRRWI
jgi:hypothetical protein